MQRRGKWLVEHALGLGLSMSLAACASRAGTVPMAGHRNQSTACLFGLRGVRVALSETATNAVDITIRMSADAKGLQHCVGSLLDGRESPQSTALQSQPSLRRVEISQQLASAQLENIRGGVRIHIIPDQASDGAIIRDELEARIVRASENSGCD